MTMTLAKDNTTQETAFFQGELAQSDAELYAAMQEEFTRQQQHIELIASENLTSRAVMQAQGSVLTNKYAEGYPGKRYYGGCEFVDKAEQLAIDRACELYNCSYANVQPLSGSQANQGVFTALLKPNDTILGMSLSAGGHLTHGAAPNQSGKWFNAIQYGVREEDGLIDYDQVEALAKEHQPKMIIAGFSAYTRVIDWAKFREIADAVGAYLLVDMAHVSGLVAGGSYPSPLPHAHIVTTTTHKTLRGPRGGMILTNEPQTVVRQTKSGKDITLGQALNSAIFPGIQGGPLMHVIAGKAAAYKEALKPEFKEYAQAIIDNARVLAETLKSRGLDIVTGGTDNHIVLVDMRPKGLTGDKAEKSLENAGLTCNKNGIPFDPQPPMVTSGIRLGTPAGTTRGFGAEEFKLVGEYIADVLDGLAENGDDNSAVEAATFEKVKALTARFPIYNEMIG